MRPVKNKSFDERTVLSGIIKFGKSAYIDCCDVLDDAYFSGFVEQAVYTSICDLFKAGQNFTKTRVFSKCMDLGLTDKDYDLFQEVTSYDCDKMEDIRPIAQKLKRQKIIKDFIALHKKVIDELSETDPSQSISSIFSISEKAIFELVKKYTERQDIPEKLSDLVEDIVQELSENENLSVGLPTPWEEVTKSIGGGLRRGNVYLFGARSGEGKSFLLQIISVYLTQLGVPVLYLDTEMTKEEILPRLLSNISEVPINDIESGLFAQNDFTKKAVASAVKVMKGMPLSYLSIAGKPFDEILSVIRRWLYTDVGLDENGRANDCLVVYDYFKLMSAEGLQELRETQLMGFMISQLADFAKKYSIPILTATQLNRDGIAKDTSDVIAGSDRLLWLVSAFAIFKEKSLEEIIRDGVEHGNKKFICRKSRFGGEHRLGEHINMTMKPEIASLLENGLKSSVVKQDADL